MASMSHDKVNTRHSDTTKRFNFLIFLAGRSFPSLCGGLSLHVLCFIGVGRSKSVGSCRVLGSMLLLMSFFAPILRGICFEATSGVSIRPRHRRLPRTGRSAAPCRNLARLRG